MQLNEIRKELQFNAVIMDTVLNKIKAINIYE